MERHRDALEAPLPGDNIELVKRSQVVVVSVKPQILPKVINQISDELTSDKLVISVAAGIPISAIESKLRAGARVVRAMPNTPALVNAGATAIAPGEHAEESDVATAKSIFDAVGLTVVLDESQPSEVRKYAVDTLRGRHRVRRCGHRR